MEKIYILSEIGGWGVWPEDIQRALQQNRGKDVEVVINSPGGYIDDGMAIYNMLRQHDGRVDTTVIGVAASMASVIFMAGETRKIETGASLMVHKPSVGMWGDAEDLRKGADYLDTMQEAILQVYVERTGKDKAEIEPLVDAETWMLGEESLALNFATETSTETFSAVASAVRHDLTKFDNTPQALQRGARAVKKADKPAEATNKPKAQHQHPNKEPAMELEKATAADVEKENPELFSAIAKAATEKEQNRIKGLEGLAKHVKDAPEKVKAAAKAEIEKLRKDPEATAQNSIEQILEATCKVQTAVENEVGQGARKLDEDVEAPAGEDNTPEATAEQATENRVAGMAAGFKQKR